RHTHTSIYTTHTHTSTHTTHVCSISTRRPSSMGNTGSGRLVWVCLKRHASNLKQGEVVSLWNFCSLQLCQHTHTHTHTHPPTHTHTHSHSHTARTHVGPFCKLINAT